MAWVTPSTKTTGQLITAAIYNADVVANPIAIYAGAMSLASQAIGDLPYAISTTQLGRLADVALGAVVGSGGVGAAPAYSRTPLLDGVTFPATQIANAGANVLDDYEEGTWTPVIGGSGGTSGQVYSTQIGDYVKIGRFVACSLFAGLSTKGTITTNLQIQGLPFTISNTTGGAAWVTLARFANLATTWVTLLMSTLNNTTTADVLGLAAASTANTTNLVTADVSNTTELRGMICFLATT